MMKFLFLCLLLINGALYAYQHGHLDPLLTNKREPVRDTRPFNAEKIVVLTPAASSDAASAAPINAGAAAAAEMGLSAQAETAPAVAAELKADSKADTKTAAKEVAACTEVGSFNLVDAVRFEQRLEPLALGARVSRLALEEVSSYIVYMPPQPDKEGADKKAGELRRLGVSEFFIIKDDSKFRWGISLGVYKTEAAAKARLAALNTQGVRSARVGEYSVSASKVAFQLRDLEPAARASVTQITADFPQQQVRSCG